MASRWVRCCGAALFLASAAQAGIALETVLAPLAFTKFCADYPEECRPSGEPNALASLEGSRRAGLETVNAAVNREIRIAARPVPESGVGGWAIAPPSGDCNDFAVTKRHRLLRMGFPSSALLLAAVKTPDGEDHLVLVVRTREGDLVLDNLAPDVRPLPATGYRVEKIQSGEDPYRWVT